MRYQQALQEGKLVVTIHAHVLSRRVVASPREQSDDPPETGDGIGMRLNRGGNRSMTRTNARKKQGRCPRRGSPMGRALHRYGKKVVHDTDTPAPGDRWLGAVS